MLGRGHVGTADELLDISLWSLGEGFGWRFSPYMVFDDYE